MKRLLILTAVVVSLAGCLPQFTGSNPLGIAATGIQSATVTFTASKAVTDVVLYIGNAQRALSAAPELDCQPFETGIQCLADVLVQPVAVTVFADPLHLVDAQAWWSTPGQAVNIARVSLR